MVLEECYYSLYLIICLCLFRELPQAPPPGEPLVYNWHVQREVQVTAFHTYRSSLTEFAAIVLQENVLGTFTF